MTGNKKLLLKAASEQLFSHYRNRLDPWEGYIRARSERRNLDAQWLHQSATPLAVANPKLPFVGF